MIVFSRLSRSSLFILTPSETNGLANTRAGSRGVMATRIERASSPAQPVAAGKGSLATWQTLISDLEGMERGAGDVMLFAHADLYGKMARRLFAEVAAGRFALSLKQE